MDRSIGNQLNICLTTKSSIKGGSKRPLLSHKISCTISFTSFGIFEVLRVLGLKNAHEMHILGDPNLEIFSMIGQAMKR